MLYCLMCAQNDEGMRSPALTLKVRCHKQALQVRVALKDVARVFLVFLAVEYVTKKLGKPPAGRPAGSRAYRVD